ncbi:hypothetical protein [Elizabethkingia miricola]|uniref:hypothetical protein n=1 Tax=Elizabethkingia miricola TaxID=172045 RepID=UPI000B35DD35|nr:hypothetical protein [Elizabethkingia miricola]NHQ68837.1 hypothetical protein [Elizabethkingia miricola]NHQ71103.1 hypothetical protein [Elizabethkingia miricola]NHQ79390.1 hypothetical protein [Elizabethkingia miricola]PSL89895.1 hypothetical protein C7V10_02800 [Elizabethkingia miricola]QHQ88496.1 hypothetical protein FE632_17530 [Elizabethkingia miricola]
MKKDKSIENLRKKLQLGGFTKTFGSKIVGGNRSLTIKEVVITVPRPAALESEYEDDNDDGDKPTDPSGPGNTGPWY